MEAHKNIRTTQEVFERHLELREKGDLETDLKENYSEDIVLLTENSDLHGHDGMRGSAGRLAEQLPNAEFEFTTKVVDGEYAFLVWKAKSNRYFIDDGADSFVIKDGKIIMQTIYYRLLPKETQQRE